MPATSIVLQRFDNLSGDDAGELLARGIAYELLAGARRKPLVSLEAYECWLRGRDCLERGTLEADAEARTFFERALGVDPHFARAYTGLSLSYFNEWSCQAWVEWDETERRAFDVAARAASARSNRCDVHRPATGPVGPSTTTPEEWKAAAADVTRGARRRTSLILARHENARAQTSSLARSRKAVTRSQE